MRTDTFMAVSIKVTALDENGDPKGPEYEIAPMQRLHPRFREIPKPMPVTVTWDWGE